MYEYSKTTNECLFLKFYDLLRSRILVAFVGEGWVLRRGNLLGFNGMKSYSYSLSDMID